VTGALIDADATTIRWTDCSAPLLAGTSVALWATWVAAGYPTASPPREVMTILG